MKRFFLIVLVFSFVSVSAYAHEVGTTYINISGGLGISSASYEAWTGETVGLELGDPPDVTLVDDAETRPGGAVNFGADFNYFLAENLSLLGGLYYDYRSFKTVYPKNTSTDDLEISFDFSFLTIPVGFRYYADILLLGGGLYYGILLTADGEAKAGSTTLSEGELEDTNDDVGIFLDLGLRFDVSETGGFITYLRYKHGLVNVFDEEDVIVTDIKLVDLTLNFGYSMKI